jgi:hypothetical protein
MDWLSPRRYADEMEAETARLTASTAQMPTDRKIETCPEWTVRDLVTHVGTGHRLAAGIIEERRDRPAGYRLVDAPEEPGEWPPWLAEGARRLNAAVDDLGFDGIADLLLALSYFPRFKGDGESLLFTATDLGQSWHVRLTKDGLEWEPADNPAEAVIKAPAKELLLIMNRRLEPDEIEGDQALWQRWRAEAKF